MSSGFLDNEMRYIFDISQAISAKMSVDMLRHVARRTSSIQVALLLSVQMKTTKECCSKCYSHRKGA
ncbi:hypothetical protein J6590_017799 [Homalodisca vitripennis]|nr:hypothetical protein J6590_017799 [Homalodisca vitripennis]